MSAAWTPDAQGRPSFTLAPWTVTQRDGRVDVSHTDPDIEVSVDVDGGEIEVFAEGGIAWEYYAVRVYLPFPVLRAILDAADKIKRGAGRKETT